MIFPLDPTLSYILVLEPDVIVQEFDAISKDDNLLITTSAKFEQICQ
jgi:hypothetical protein